MTEKVFMKVSINWLKTLVDLKVSVAELESLLPLRTIGLKDVTSETIELDMKGYNRADLLSMRGVAYEVSAITASQILFKEILPPELYWNELTDPEDREYRFKDNLPKLNVEVKDREYCPFYCVVKIEGLKVDPSPKEWVQKLESCGMRPVNNIADLTNLIMLEYGQPLHAFDASQVSNETIIVRTARESENIETLDGKKRELMQTDLLITDPEKAIGIAGVMGGKNSEITDSTTSILLEAAIFDPKALRKTATRLGLVSEAGKRFYHGLTLTRLYQALDAAIRAYEHLGGRAVSFHIEMQDLQQWSDPSLDPIRRISLTLSKTRSLIGVDISAEEIIEILKKLGCQFVGQRQKDDDSIWTIEPPYWRLDLEIEEDLIEEVARMYGYEKIPAKELVGEIPEEIDQTKFDLNYSIKKTLAELGLTEIQTYSFFSNEVLENLQLDKNSLIKLANPISSETEYLRNNLWPNVLETVIKNQKQNFSDMAIFEVGKVYNISETGEPEENYHLSIGLMNHTDNPIEELLEIFKQLNSKLNLGIEIGKRNETEIQEKEFHPTRFVNLTKKGKDIGKIAEVHPRIVNKFGIEKRIAIAEFDLNS